MTHAEFVKWVEDFSKRFPDVGQWLRSKPATMQIWFDDCFSMFELQDCRAVNIQLMTDGLMAESWNRDKIPASFVKRVAEIRAARAKRQEQVMVRKHAGERAAVTAQPNFRSGWECVNQILKLRPEVRREFVDQFFDARDPITTAEAWVTDPADLQEPKRTTLFAKVPTEEEVREHERLMREQKEEAG